MSLLATCLQLGTEPPSATPNRAETFSCFRFGRFGNAQIVNRLSIGAMAFNACARFNVCVRPHSLKRLDNRLKKFSGIYT